MRVLARSSSDVPGIKGIVGLLLSSRFVLYVLLCTTFFKIGTIGFTVCVREFCFLVYVWVCVFFSSTFHMFLLCVVACFTPVISFVRSTLQCLCCVMYVFCL